MRELDWLKTMTNFVWGFNSIFGDLSEWVRFRLKRFDLIKMKKRRNEWIDFDGLIGESDA